MPADAVKYSCAAELPLIPCRDLLPAGGEKEEDGEPIAPLPVHGERMPAGR